MENNKNLLIAVGLSVLILLSFHYFYEKPRIEALRQQQLIAQQQAAQQPQQQGAAPQQNELRDRAAVMAESPRVRINTPSLHGSVNLKGGRIDDVTLANYQETLDPASPEIVLLSPAGSASPHQAYYAEFGWLGQNVKLPDANTVWQADSTELRPDRPLRLTWDNGEGLQFERMIAVDEHFMFTITDKVKNASPDRNVTLFPFGLISRHGQPPLHDLFILHEGAIGVFDHTLNEHKYKDLVKEGKMTEHSQGGWLGFTDKYWLTALVPDQSEAIDASFTFSADKSGVEKAPIGTFQSDFRSTARELTPGAETTTTLRLFVGAKELRQLYAYKDQHNIPMFENAIDFGWFFFFTKPFLYLLDMLGRLLGNFGLAILLFTVLLRLATLPLSMKSYESMARMKNLQPEITKLQEKHKEDQMQLSMAMMELYKKEKVNPMSGCMPNLIQIPIFFALYKVLFVGIELRHAPFYGWVQDLSAPDPTSVLSLFGLIPWSWIPHIGVWPILMGLSMWLQQRLSPQPPDKTQAQIFAWMPLLFTFMLAPMAAGLIIYWTWSNLLGIAQQWLIMKRMEQKGYKG